MTDPSVLSAVLSAVLQPKRFSVLVPEAAMLEPDVSLFLLVRIVLNPVSQRDVSERNRVVPCTNKKLFYLLVSIQFPGN